MALPPRCLDFGGWHRSWRRRVIIKCDMISPWNTMSLMYDVLDCIKA
jgi:hypothetical protein